MTTEEAKRVASVFVKRIGFPENEVREAFKQIMAQADKWISNMPEGIERTALHEVLSKIKETGRDDNFKEKDIADFFEEYLWTRWDKFEPHIS